MIDIDKLKAGITETFRIIDSNELTLAPEIILIDFLLSCGFTYKNVIDACQWIDSVDPVLDEEQLFVDWAVANA